MLPQGTVECIINAPPAHSGPDWRRSRRNFAVPIGRYPQLDAGEINATVEKGVGQCGSKGGLLLHVKTHQDGLMQAQKQNNWALELRRMFGSFFSLPQVLSAGVVHRIAEIRNPRTLRIVPHGPPCTPQCKTPMRANSPTTHPLV